MLPYNLDNLIGALTTRLRTWSTGLGSNKSWDILYYLVRCMWLDSGGRLHKARFRFAQASLSIKLGINKKWINVLCQRLVKAGWLEYETIKLIDGTNSSCIWRAGRLLKRLMVTLAQSKQRKSSIKDTVADAPPTVPSKEGGKPEPSCQQTGGQGSDGGFHHKDWGPEESGARGEGLKEVGRRTQERIWAEDEAEVDAFFLRYRQEHGRNKEE